MRIRTMTIPATHLSLLSSSEFEKINSPLMTLMQNPTLYYRCQNTQRWEMNFISESCYDVTDYTAEKFLSHKIEFGELIPNSESLILWDAVQEAIAHKQPFHLFYHIRTLKNHTKVVHEQGKAIFGSDGKLLELQGF